MKSCLFASDRTNTQIHNHSKKYMWANDIQRKLNDQGFELENESKVFLFIMIYDSNKLIGMFNTPMPLYLYYYRNIPSIDREA